MPTLQRFFRHRRQRCVPCLVMFVGPVMHEFRTRVEVEKRIAVDLFLHG